MMDASCSTPLCELLGISVPVVQGAIGNATCPRLAAAVSNAGGLGMLALSWSSLDEVRSAIRETRALTDRPFGVNLVIDFPQQERLAVCLDEGAPVVSTFWGDPSPYREAIARGAAVHLHTVSSAEQARVAADVGVDVVVAQGWEAGGHVGGMVTTLTLVPSVVDAVGSVPVIAAGGIADGRGLAAVLALGAQGVWVGTRFLLAEEANVHDEYRRRVIAAVETDTVWSRLFDGGWPNAPHRVLRNSTVSAWEERGRPERPHRPGESEVVAWRADGSPLERYWFDEPDAMTTGDVEALPLYAGQGAALVHGVSSAGDIVRDLVAGARDAVGGASGAFAAAAGDVPASE